MSAQSTIIYAMLHDHDDDDDSVVYIEVSPGLLLTLMRVGCIVHSYIGKHQR